MEKLKDLHEQATECRVLAAKASDPEYKAQLLELAARWATLADEREKLLELQNRLHDKP